MNYSSPQAIHLQDYIVPDFLIETVDLEVDLHEEFTTVKSHLTIQANPGHAKAGAVDLVLLGDELELESVAINGKVLTADQYKNTYQT
jgi:aminopeptidase N